MLHCDPELLWPCHKSSLDTAVSLRDKLHHLKVVRSTIDEDISRVLSRHSSKRQGTCDGKATVHIHNSWFGVRTSMEALDLLSCLRLADTALKVLTLSPLEMATWIPTHSRGIQCQFDLIHMPTRIPSGSRAIIEDSILFQTNYSFTALKNCPIENTEMRRAIYKPTNTLNTCKITGTFKRF